MKLCSLTDPSDVAWGCYSNQPNLQASWPVPVSDWLTNQVEVSGHHDGASAVHGCGSECKFGISL